MCIRDSLQAHARHGVPLQRGRPAFAAARRPDAAHPPRGHEHGSHQAAALRSGLNRDRDGTEKLGRTTLMPRLAFIDEDDLDLEAQALIASAERTGAPDPRVAVSYT